MLDGRALQGLNDVCFSNNTVIVSLEPDRSMMQGDDDRLDLLVLAAVFKSLFDRVK